MTSTGEDARPVWRRCWCYRYGRCLVDCPTADVPAPHPLTDARWQQGYSDALAMKNNDGDRV